MATVDFSPIFGLPWINGSQNAPNLTLNEALLILQAMFGGVLGQQNAPPVGPDNGDAWLVGSAGSGDWNDKDNCIAIYYGASGWLFLPGFDNSTGEPIAIGADHEGLRVWRRDLNCGFVWTGSAWVEEGGAMESTTVAAAGSAAGPIRWKFITDEAGGPTPAFNDGTNWRRPSDLAIIS